MNRKITRLALPGYSGARAANGLSVLSSAAIKSLMIAGITKEPATNDLIACLLENRKFIRILLIDKDEFVAAEKHPHHAGPGFYFLFRAVHSITSELFPVMGHVIL